MDKVSFLTLLAALSSAACASAQAAPAVVGATVSVATAPVCRELGCRLLGNRIDRSGPSNPTNVSTYVLPQGQRLEEVRLHLPGKPGHGQTVRLLYDRGTSAYGAVNAAKLASGGAGRTVTAAQVRGCWNAGVTSAGSPHVISQRGFNDPLVTCEVSGGRQTVTVSIAL
ncbi:hypothetical protein GCM10017783_00970 [Deinococcus piscis]|uniref:Secreted protein n=1 Tax=Deinococcus piscis TaxID=394230 RepID=A0ABQ3JX11_9DEIO|nr:hypothetical protein [Deinococcus piscis]GHF92920.1 hypothetical protein GCM10017783_00970 [Deinococcus piscis]